MHELMSRFSIIHRQSYAYLDRHLRHTGVTSSEYAYLLVICENPGISQDEVGRRLQIDKGPVARAMKQLERVGFISKEIPQSDKRKRLIYPTEKGKEGYATIRKAALESEHRLTQSLTVGEEEELVTLLDKIIKSL